MSNKQTANNLPSKGPGRPKGSVNKLGKEAKQVIAEAAEKLGGAKRLLEWCQEDERNERAFWSTIYPKLIPLTVQGDPDNPIVHQHDINPAEKLKAMVANVSERSGEAGRIATH
jgi:hypothetical protein